MSLNYVLQNNDVLRIDSGYFQRQYLDDEKAIRLKGSHRLSELGVQIKSFGAYSLNSAVQYLEVGVPFIRGVNMKGGRINFDNMIFISDEANSLLWKSEVKPGNVLLSMSGTIGEVAIAAKSWDYPINSNQDIAKIDTKGHMNPYTLFVFLLSRFGQNFLLREARGSVQQHVFLSQIEQLEVPKFSPAFDAAIQHVAEQSDDTIVQANAQMTQAEQTLLRALGLDNWKAPEPLSYVRSSSDAFAAGRLDAEHFQEGNYALRKVLTSCRTGYVKLCDLSQKFTNGAEIREYQESGTPYLRIGDLKNLSINSGSVVFVDPVAAVEVIDKVRLEKGDVLISRSGSLAVSAVVEREWESALISSHLIRVRISDKFFDPYFVALFLKTLPGRMQIMQWSNGGVQPEISQPSLGQLVVPKVPATVQLDIRRLILEAANGRKRSTDLLNVAKRAVEIAIEQDENVAMAFLKANV